MANGSTKTRKAAKTASDPGADGTDSGLPCCGECGRQHVPIRIDSARAAAIRQAAAARGLPVSEWVIQAICVALHDHHHRIWQPDAIWIDGSAA